LRFADLVEAGIGVLYAGLCPAVSHEVDRHIESAYAMCVEQVLATFDRDLSDWTENHKNSGSPSRDVKWRRISVWCGARGGPRRASARGQERCDLPR